MAQNCAMFFHFRTMKKILFYVLAIATLILGIRIGTIIIRDFDRLTKFGYGYLTGLLILFLLCLLGSLWMGKKVFREL
jgi:hypothetical protein